MSEAFNLFSQLPLWSKMGTSVGLLVTVLFFIAGCIVVQRPVPPSQDATAKGSSQTIRVEGINNSNITINAPMSVVTPSPTLPIPKNAFVMATGATLQLVSPKSGDVVDRNMIVNVSSDGLRSTDEVYVYVLPGGNGIYYPQRIVPSNGTWSDIVVVGTAADSSRKFTIGTFVTDDKGAEYLDSIQIDKLRKLPPGFHGPKVEVSRR